MLAQRNNEPLKLFTNRNHSILLFMPVYILYELYMNIKCYSVLLCRITSEFGIAPTHSRPVSIVRFDGLVSSRACSGITSFESQVEVETLQNALRDTQHRCQKYISDIKVILQRFYRNYCLYLDLKLVMRLHACN